MVRHLPHRYTLNVVKSFSAQHVLTVVDEGPESIPHAHAFKVIVALSGDTLDAAGYLVDITAVEATLHTVIGYFSECLLNDLPEFAGLNPSLEHFARIFFERLAEEWYSSNDVRIRKVTLWEDDLASIEYSPLGEG